MNAKKKMTKVNSDLQCTEGLMGDNFGHQTLIAAAPRPAGLTFCMGFSANSINIQRHEIWNY